MGEVCGVTMRHKDFHPVRIGDTMGELNQKTVSGLDAEQLSALNDFARTYREALPRMNEIAAAAMKVRDDFISADTWRMVEGDNAGQPQPLWSVGPPKINYVDSIELSQVPHSAAPIEDEESES